MTPVTFVQGDSKVLRVTVIKDGEPMPLAGLLGATYRAARRYGASSVIDKTLGDGVTVNDADAGIVDITFVPDDTQSLSGDFLHELELTEASGDVLTAFQGFLSLDQALIP